MARAPETGLPESELEERIEALESIGYAGGTQTASARSGVTTSRPSPGPTRYLVTDGHAPSAFLMDDTGRVLHTWPKEYYEAYPRNEVDGDTDGIGCFRRAALLDDEELLAIYEGHGLITNRISSRPSRGVLTTISRSRPKATAPSRCSPARPA